LRQWGGGSRYDFTCHFTGLNLWKRLLRYFDDGKDGFENNLIENANHPIASVYVKLKVSGQVKSTFIINYKFLSTGYSRNLGS
jgi:hypothetical protein